MTKVVLVLLSVLVFCSCKKEESFEPYSMYGLLIEEFNHKSYELKSEISDKTQTISNDSLLSEIKLFNEIISDYITYIENTNDYFLNSERDNLTNIQTTNSYFFEKNGEYSLKGKEYIDKTNSCREELLKLTNNDKFKYKIKNAFTTQDITDRYNQQIPVLNFFFKDTPLISVITYLKKKQIDVLEIEKQFILDKQNCY